MAAGVPEGDCHVPRGHDVGQTLLTRCQRVNDFRQCPDSRTVRWKPACSGSRPRFSKILFGDDVVISGKTTSIMMVESIFSNSGRSCINCSGIWASRHTEEIAQAPERLGPVDVLPPQDPNAGLAAFTNAKMATGTWAMVQQDIAASGVKDMTADSATACGATTLRLFATCHCSCEFARLSGGGQGIHVPIHQRREVCSERYAEQNWIDARLHGDHQRSAVHRCAGREHPH